MITKIQLNNREIIEVESEEMKVEEYTHLEGLSIQFTDIEQVGYTRLTHFLFSAIKPMISIIKWDGSKFRNKDYILTDIHLNRKFDGSCEAELEVYEVKEID